jgi:hypothetical protein
LKSVVLAVLVSASLALASLSACSSSDTTATTSDAGGADSSSATDASSKGDTSAADSSTEKPDGATGCTTIVNGASESTSATVKGNAPAPTGGTIADGTYFLNEFSVYDPAGTASAPSPSGLKVTLFIQGNLMLSVQELPDGSVSTFSETFVVAGTDLNRTLTCPKAAPDLKAVYSVAGSKLTIYETDASSGTVAGSVYVKQ